MMMTILAVIITIQMMASYVVGAADGDVTSAPVAVTDDDGTTLLKSWILYHLVDNNEYVARNKISMKLKKESDSIVKDNNNAQDMIEMIIEPIINTDYNSTIITNEFKSMLYNNQSNKFYQLKIVDDDDHDSIVYTSVPSCSIIRANYRDEIIITLNPYGTLLSFHYIPLISSLASKTCDTIKDTDTIESSFWKTTKITYEIDTPAMIIKNVLSGTQYKPPIGLKRIPNSINPYPILHRQLNQQQGTTGTSTTNTVPGGAAGTIPGIFPDDQQKQLQQQDQGGISGFFRRYWYIIVPMMLFQLLSSNTEQPAPPSDQAQAQPQLPNLQPQLPNQPGGAGNRGGGGANATTSNSPRGGGGGDQSNTAASRRRRGKRD